MRASISSSQNIGCNARSAHFEATSRSIAKNT
jgi:hypothetical protein